VLFPNVSHEFTKLYGAIWFSGHIEPNNLPVAHPHSLFQPAFIKFPQEVIALRPRHGAGLFREKPTEFVAIENSLLCISPFQNLKYFVECAAELGGIADVDREPAVRIGARNSVTIGKENIRESLLVVSSRYHIPIGQVWRRQEHGINGQGANRPPIAVLAQVG
jgi:hypothetical protein